MAPFRLALCITELEVGGAEKAFVELACRLNRDQFQPVAYCLGSRPQGDKARLAERLEEADLQVHYLNAASSRHILRVAGRLRALLAHQEPHLLQSFLFHANLVGRFAARQAAVPKVLSGVRVAEPRGWHRWLDRLTQSMVDRQVCVSESVARFCRDKTKLPPEKLVVIPNGVDLASYRNLTPTPLRCLGLPEDTRLVTYAGRLDAQKGVRWLLRTAPEWLAELKDCRLLVVGRGPEQRRLERLSGKLGLADRVLFVGWRPDLPEILAASNLVVLPSRWEGMPNILLEAMATGRPVLATDVEGVRELLGADWTQQTVPFGNTAAFSAKIIRIMSDAQVASKLGRHNRQRARQMFPVQRMVHRYEKLWQEILNK